MDATIIGKLKKITALIDRAGTPGEAEAAAAALSRLLLKYNLDEATVRTARGEEPTSSVIVKRVTIHQGSRGIMWRWNLLNVIARHNLTKVIRDLTTGNSGWIVGTQQNIDVVMDLYEHIATTAERLADAAFATEYRPIHRRKFTTAFLLGFGRGLSEKFAAERQEQRKDAATNALVLVVERDLNQAISTEIGRIKPGKRQQINDASAYESGKIAGRNYTSNVIRDESYAALE